MKGLIFVLLMAVALTSGFDLRKDVKRLVKPIFDAVNNPKILISEGLTADAEEFNFQVGLSTTINLDSKWCGGCLISPEWIVTAAHCTAGARFITAYLGSTQKRSGTKAKVLETVIHSGWNETTLANDISLLRIAPITLGPNINIIKLPALSSYGLYPNYLNEKVIASGWGNINDEGDSSEKLQYAHLEIVSNLVCSKTFGYAMSSIICTKGQNATSICSGDSGGPLVTESNETLVGITSFGAQKCTLGFPIGFTRITSYRSWIWGQTGV